MENKIGATGTYELGNCPCLRSIILPDQSSGGSHGTVTANAAYASLGAAIVLTVIPDAGYRVSVWAGGPDRQTVVLTQSGTVYTFLMPAFHVTIHAEFSKI